MSWITLAFGAALSWGMYGASLHRGQLALGSPMRALLCVGAAYFLIGVIVPVAALGAQGGLSGFNTGGLVTATIAGALGAIGAACIIRNGGSPTYVMPIVFGFAPLVNVLTTMVIHPPKSSVSPLLYLGFLLTAAGAGMVLYFRPQS